MAKPVSHNPAIIAITEIAIRYGDLLEPILKEFRQALSGYDLMVQITTDYDGTFAISVVPKSRRI